MKEADQKLILYNVSMELASEFEQLAGVDPRPLRATTVSAAMSLALADTAVEESTALLSESVWPM